MQPKSYHPLIFVVFLVAIFLVVPFQIEGVLGALRWNHSPVGAIAILVASSLILIVPLLHADRQTRRYPDRFRPRLLSRVTWVIIAGSMFLCVGYLATYLAYAG